MSIARAELLQLTGPTLPATLRIVIDSVEGASTSLTSQELSVSVV